MIGRWNCEYCACRTKKRKQFFFLELRRRVACHLINEKKNKVLRSGGKSWSKHTHTPQNSNKKLYNVPHTTIKWPNQRELRILCVCESAEDSKFSNHLSQTLFTLNFVVKSKCIYPELRALSELTQIPTPYHLQNTNKNCRRPGAFKIFIIYKHISCCQTNVHLITSLSYMLSKIF